MMPQPRAAVPQPGVVVFLDDDERVVNTYRRYFSEWGYPDRAEFATTTDEADALLASGRVIGLFSDWDMPGKDGITYLAEVRLAKPDLPLGLLTAYIGSLEPLDWAGLHEANIDVFDKGHISAEGEGWLIRLAVPEAVVPLRPYRLPFKETDDMDQIAADTADLLAKLEKILDKKSLVIYGIAGRPYSVEDVISEVRRETPLGRKFVRLHGEVRRPPERRPPVE
jgi:CheY-like chemotaxis protein